MDDGRQRREETNHASEYVKFGCMNVRGWGVGKFEDVCRELEEWKFDIVRLTETHLRDDMRMEGCEYVMIGKERRTQETLGGGIVLLYKKGRGLKVEEIDVGRCESSEDVMAVRVECKNKVGRTEKMVVGVVYMTVMRKRADRENRRKYDILRRVVREQRE
ncbi:hypothetical protein E2C01_066495 [Portunus trituberculatus]|uniref:Craniofacial development protein 2 n=1 Tax=Portunus trituberculatus TaxID=210409 RepID=A0A5B7HTZ5_PORTR|nr:hypothetical protein [Portunus trituberculatus]